MYAIVDIETTGGNFRHEKITEIAIITHDGEKITGKFNTLINPEKRIPPPITRLTGISNEMVKGAPKFYEIAKKIVELTGGKVFVAHNAGFDYNFVRNEFKSLGFDFQRKTLCTVKLSRKLIPFKRSYSLGNICKELGVHINNRHRASGDAIATARLFEILIAIDSEKKLFQNELKINLNSEIHPSFSPEILDNLPEDTGVYYFHNDKNDVIYIGKSNNIKKRVIAHFRNAASARALNMKKEITDITFEITGSELVALLLESSEIKKHKPLYNRSQRRTAYRFVLNFFTDENGYLRFSLTDINLAENCLLSFPTKNEGKLFLFKTVQKYRLCQKLCDLYESAGTCFQYHTKECMGACIGEESPESYNKRARQFIDACSLKTDNLFIIDKGRTTGENAVIKIENGKYCGFGYSNNELKINHTEFLHDIIKPYDDNRDVQQIIKNSLRNRNLRTIRW